MPRVRLADQMQESAFENPPWLIEREGAGYVQVTESAVPIAEHCDGRQTLEEIASAVSEATGRTVSADNVRQLAGSQLLAKGLISTEDGKVIGATAGSRSLLALSLRSTMIGPDALLPVARPFQLLLWPPVRRDCGALSVGPRLALPHPWRRGWWPARCSTPLL